MSPTGYDEVVTLDWEEGTVDRTGISGCGGRGTGHGGAGTEGGMGHIVTQVITTTTMITLMN